jgi:hypothetical protein
MPGALFHDRAGVPRGPSGQHVKLVEFSPRLAGPVRGDTP